MAYFYIDYENLCGKSLEGISLIKLKRSDKITIFYSENAANLTFEFHKELENIKAEKKYILIERKGPNSLDFQLSSYLGACIQEYPEQEHYIVSQDKGFDIVCRFWQSRNICVKRINAFYHYYDLKNNTF